MHPQDNCPVVMRSMLVVLYMVKILMTKHLLSSSILPAKVMIGSLKDNVSVTAKPSGGGGGGGWSRCGTFDLFFFPSQPEANLRIFKTVFITRVNLKKNNRGIHIWLQNGEII